MIHACKYLFILKLYSNSILYYHQLINNYLSFTSGVCPFFLYWGDFSANKYLIIFPESYKFSYYIYETHDTNNTVCVMYSNLIFTLRLQYTCGISYLWKGETILLSSILLYTFRYTRYSMRFFVIRRLLGHRVWPINIDDIFLLNNFIETVDKKNQIGC